MIVKEVSCRVARELVQRVPRGLSVERRVEERLDPGGVEVFGRGVPTALDTPIARARPSRLGRDRHLRTGHDALRSAYDRLVFAWFCVIHRRDPEPRTHAARIVGPHDDIAALVDDRERVGAR